MIETWIHNHPLPAAIAAFFLAWGFIEGVHKLVWWHRKHSGE
jgi:hypothetical protein